MKKKLDVVAALIGKEDKVLICQRHEHDKFGGLWEFPGGTVEDGEGKEEAIRREIEEELGVVIEIKRFVERFSDENEVLYIDVYLYECRIVSGELKPKDCQDFLFLTLKEACEKNLAPVDRKILAYLKKD